MKFYRVRENRGEFIPQVASLFQVLFFAWKGIDKDYGNPLNRFTWYTHTYQSKYCVVNSLEEAIDVINSYKKFKKEAVVKYHKVPR